LAVGLALADTLDAYINDPTRIAIKWPNDLWIDEKKCSGILVEAVATGARIDGVVIGIGLNVNRIEWPEELRGLATSLQHATQRHFDRSDVLATLLSSAESRVDLLVREGPETIVRAVDARLALRGQQVRCDDVSGTLIGVAPSGALRIDTGPGIKDVIAGTLTRAVATS
jgi:BirA family biotin operon repressor/biotin-[acetyl-CoA-carboxylase] ligase